jgi:hypothetical protein
MGDINHNYYEAPRGGSDNSIDGMPKFISIH